MYCTRCGAANPDGAGACANCGNLLVSSLLNKSTDDNNSSQPVGSATPDLLQKRGDGPEQQSNEPGFSNIQQQALPNGNQTGGNGQGSSYGPGSVPQQNGEVPRQRDWLVTLLLSIFLGYLGVHRFYTGHIWIGVAQLLTAGGCGIWQLIDIILIATDNYRDAEGRPLFKSL